MSGMTNSDHVHPTGEKYQSEKIHDGRRFLLPYRRLGSIKKYAAYATVLGVVASAIMFFWTVLPMLFEIKSLIVNAFGAAGKNANEVDDFLAILTIVFGLITIIPLFFIVKFTLLALAVQKEKTRCEVTIRETHIFHRELFYGFSFKLKQAISDIDGIYLTPLLDQEETDNGDGKDPFEFLHRLIGEDVFALGFKKRKPIPIAFGYPLDVLEPIANEIRAELMRRHPDGREDLQIVKRESYRPTAAELVADMHQADPDSGDWEVLAKEDCDLILPLSSRLTVSKQDGATVYRLPKKGRLLGERKSFLSALTAAAILMTSTGVAAFFKFVDVPTAIFLTGVMGIALIVFVVACYLKSREAMIGFDGELLFVEEKTVLGTRWHEFKLANIASVSVEDSNLKINDVPVKHLCIRRKEGKSLCRFSQLSNQELFWLAQQLERSLGLK